MSEVNMKNNKKGSIKTVLILGAVSLGFYLGFYLLVYVGRS